MVLVLRGKREKIISFYNKTTHAQNMFTHRYENMRRYIRFMYRRDRDRVVPMEEYRL